MNLDRTLPKMSGSACVGNYILRFFLPLGNAPDADKDPVTLIEKEGAVGPDLNVSQNTKISAGEFGKKNISTTIQISSATPDRSQFEPPADAYDPISTDDEYVGGGRWRHRSRSPMRMRGVSKRNRYEEYREVCSNSKT